VLLLYKQRASSFVMQGIDRYVKRKKLDPLETYVPLVLEARERLATLDTVFGEQHLQQQWRRQQQQQQRWQQQHWNLFETTFGEAAAAAVEPAGFRV
jgi:hypothetical protein